MRDLLVIAAGKGKRLGSEVSKALIEIDGVPNLEHMIIQTSPFVRNIVVIVSHEDESQFVYLLAKYEKIVIVPIQSGGGTGQAILDGVDACNKLGVLGSSFITIWGDTYIKDASIFKKYLDIPMEKDKLIVPLYQTRNPYVSFELDDGNLSHVLFSSHGEFVEEGYRDINMFLVGQDIIHYLRNMHSVFKKHDKFVTDTGELPFLYLIHYMHTLYIPAEPLFIKEDCYTLSYNSPEQLQYIENEVRKGK